MFDVGKSPALCRCFCFFNAGYSVRGWLALYECVSNIFYTLRSSRPGREQLDALARTLGVPAGALLAELAGTLDPSRTQGEHALLSAYRAMNTRQQGALLEIARGLAGHPSPRRTKK